MSTNFSTSCPIPITQYPKVLLAHGGGGKLMHQLIEKMFVGAFGNSLLDQGHDAVVFEGESEKMAFTTDSYVVQPLIFPGGNIGTLAINGTVNDLAMSGACPHYLSVGFIIEEGLSMETLWTIVQSMKRAADEAGVQIVTGDTKVVDKGKGDGLFINTSGIGFVGHSQQIHPSQVRPGDAVIVNGDIGRHGMAIMAQREGLSFENNIESDTAPLAGLINNLVSEEMDVHCLRDLTRGGMASTLNEIASVARVSIHIDERSVPVREDVAGACEMLGFDPLYVACEGRFVAFIPHNHAGAALKIMQAHPYGKGARLVGQVKARSSAPVIMKSKIGVERIVDMISGEQLPRIC